MTSVPCAPEALEGQCELTDMLFRHLRECYQKRSSGAAGKLVWPEGSGKDFLRDWVLNRELRVAACGMRLVRLEEKTS